MQWKLYVFYAIAYVHFTNYVMLLLLKLRKFMTDTYVSIYLYTHNVGPIIFHQTTN